MRPSPFTLGRIFCLYLLNRERANLLRSVETLLCEQFNFDFVLHVSFSARLCWALRSLFHRRARK